MGSLVTVLFGAAVGVGIVLGLWLLADLVTDLQRHVHGATAVVSRTSARPQACDASMSGRAADSNAP